MILLSWVESELSATCSVLWILSELLFPASSLALGDAFECRRDLCLIFVPLLEGLLKKPIGLSFPVASA